jgi:hypothetical protein
MSERRFNEEEVAAIFERAIQAQQAQSAAPNQLTSGEGMTLGQLQEIGREIGLAPEQIAGAARSVARTGRTSARKFLGLTIGVGRTVELDRKLSEDEWERLVVDLRETFDAKGKLSAEGNLRQWTNGNLQALLEPTPSGHRLRLRTMKGDSRALLSGGIAMLVASTVMGAFAALYLIPNRGEGFDTFVSLAVVGVAMLTMGAIRLPGWARLRKQQMEDVAARLAESTSRTA